MRQKPFNILLVEDDEIDAETVLRAFKTNNLNNPVYTAGNGLEALEFLEGERDGSKIPLPRVILLDLNMPKMNGIEFLKKIREDERLKNLSVFVLTTSNDDRDKVEAFDLNVAGYILKPVDFKKFVDAMGTLNAYWTLTEHLE